MAYDSDRLVRTTKAELGVMVGRPMQGWLPVADEHLTTNAQLRTWARRPVEHAGSLSPKH